MTSGISEVCSCSQTATLTKCWRTQIVTWWNTGVPLRNWSKNSSRAPLARWQTWEGKPCPALPPLRVILVWDNLAGHLTPDLVLWL